MAPVHLKITIAQALEILEMTAHELAVRANVHTGTVMRAMVPGLSYKTNITSAEAIADALGLTVEDIHWANGLSYIGRPAHTGRPISTKMLHVHNNLCPVHNLVLPATNVCDYCA